jgi:class 3 adenylate cyclase
LETPQTSTLLIVDDSVENLQILSNLLKENYKIKIAKNGEKAIEIAMQVPQPDLILLDIMMPGLDGFEVCKLLKENLTTQNIPVIFLTALNEVADETKGFQVGGADFITKPFNPDIVKARIHTHLSLQSERKKSESLLKILLPENVIHDLMSKGKHTPETHENVSILFSDFVGFTSITSQLSPEFLIEELTEIFTSFDEIAERNQAMRIKTIGDAYMATTGLGKNDEDHAKNLVNTALQFISYLNERNKESNQQWHCRVGVHSGNVIAGIIGKSRFIYDILGDSVNIAARVESAGTAMRVTITESTKSLLGNTYQFETLGNVNLKGKGEMPLYLVEKV